MVHTLKLGSLYLDNKPVTPGFRFRSRLLKVGNKKGVPNEWDTALDIVGDSDEFWHWEDLFFWGQEVIKRNESNRANRWCGSDRNHNYNSASYRDRYLGFRPVLEPLSADISSFKQNQEVLVIGSNGAVIGNLEDMTQYDIILRPKPRSLVGRASFAANMRDGRVAVDRSRILSIAYAYR